MIIVYKKVLLAEKVKQVEHSFQSAFEITMTTQSASLEITVK